MDTATLSKIMHFFSGMQPVAHGGKTMYEPKSALVVWYSQTGNTRRCGRLMAKTLENEGLSVRLMITGIFSRKMS
jgi:hypothetical protein